MKVTALVIVFCVLQAILLIAQTTSLISTYWTSWDLKFNWTQTADLTRRPTADGQLGSQGHAGLWSRCVRVYRTDKNFNDSQKNTYNCLHNYDDTNSTVPYSFGKVCKTATAGLCVGEAAVTFALIVVVIVTTCWPKSPRFLRTMALPLLLLQGVVAFTIPITYLSGNMAELVDQLTAAYGALLVVHMEAWYIHDWGFWTQVGLTFLWISASGIYVTLHCAFQQNTLSISADTNGRKKETGEITEMEALRSDK